MLAIFHLLGPDPLAMFTVGPGSIISPFLFLIKQAIEIETAQHSPSSYMYAYSYIRAHKLERRVTPKFFYSTSRQ